jgi:hypothetical protein
MSLVDDENKIAKTIHMIIPIVIKNLFTLKFSKKEFIKSYNTCNS